MTHKVPLLDRDVAFKSPEEKEILALVSAIQVKPSFSILHNGKSVSVCLSGGGRHLNLVVNAVFPWFGARRVLYNLRATPELGNALVSLARQGLLDLDLHIPRDIHNLIVEFTYRCFIPVGDGKLVFSR